MKVPILQTDSDTWWHRRDPRVKWALFFLLVVMIYVAPSWAWMAGMVAVGVLLVITSRAPLKFVALLLLIQIPNIAGLIIFPMLGGEFELNAEFYLGLRLALGWVAAILIGVSLISTMDVDEMVAGLRGLGVPRRVAFAVGYAFVLVYLSFSDLARVIEAMKLKGLRFSVLHPLLLVSAMLSMFVPTLITVARRGGAMIGTLEMRGALDKETRAPRNSHVFDWADGLTAVLALLTVSYAGAIRAEAVSPPHPLLGHQQEQDSEEAGGDEGDGDYQPEAEGNESKEE